MTNRKLIILMIGFGIYLFIPCFIDEVKGQMLKKLSVHETTLRKKSIKTIVPKYPKEAIKVNASGVAVSEITISEDGTVVDVKILESPHSSINASMIEALKQWKFNPFYLNGKPQKVSGKITFYFVLENKKAKVESPY